MDPTLLCRKLIQLSTEQLEMHMGNWIEAPVVKWMHGPKTVLDLSHGGWHLERYHDGDDHLDLILNQYPGKSRKFLATIHAKERLIDFEGTQYSVREFEEFMNS